MVAGIYYNLSVDYATQLWDEFVKSIGNTNVFNGISRARYWSLILQFAYDKEGIMVPKDEEMTDFLVYHYQIFVEENPDVFPTVAHIPDVML